MGSVDPTKGQADRLALIAKNSRRPYDEVVEVWQERAAIREFLAGMPRREAERVALDDAADLIFRRA